MEKYMVVYYSKYGSIVVESGPYDDYDSAATQQKDSRQKEFPTIAYSQIEKRYYY